MEFQIKCHLGYEVSGPASFYLTLRSHKMRFSASLPNISRLEEQSTVRRWL